MSEEISDLPQTESTKVELSDREPTEEENLKFDQAVENVAKLIKPKLKSLPKNELIAIIAEYQVRLGLAQQLIENYKGQSND